MDKLVEVQITFPSDQVAKDICQILVEEKLAACVNISPIHSIYSWEGHIHSEPEYLALLKTTPSKLDSLIAKTKSMHPYGVPSILWWEINSVAEYTSWIHETLA